MQLLEQSRMRPRHREGEAMVPCFRVTRDWSGRLARLVKAEMSASQPAISIGGFLREAGLRNFRKERMVVGKLSVASGVPLPWDRIKKDFEACDLSLSDARRVISVSNAFLTSQLIQIAERSCRPVRGHSSSNQIFRVPVLICLGWDRVVDVNLNTEAGKRNVDSIFSALETLSRRMLIIDGDGGLLRLRMLRFSGGQRHVSDSTPSRVSVRAA